MKWISVDDELPQAGVEVLAFNGERFLACLSVLGWVDTTDYQPIVSVTHWMELPPKP